uniref:BESS domain-containing protein n=1 Tax=Strongyloides venezuelensis TaxID=75913 RepID=A0A0K0F704_STRVS
MEGTNVSECMPAIFVGTSKATNNIILNTAGIPHTFRHVSSNSDEEEYSMEKFNSRKHSNMVDFSQMIRAEIFKAVNSNCEDENIVDTPRQDPMMRTRKVNLVAQLQHYFKEPTIYINEHSQGVSNAVVSY